MNGTNHFTSEYIGTAFQLLKIALPNIEHFKAELYQFAGKAMGIFITFKDVKEDEFILLDGLNFESLQNRLAALTNDLARLDDMLPYLIENPEKVIGGWKKDTIFIIKGGTNLEEWKPEKAVTDIAVLLTALLGSKDGEGKNIQTCYLCNRIATCIEHVPPKCIFPEKKDINDGNDYRKNLITVPSCDQHNLVKSKDDEYLLYILAISMSSNEIALNQFKTKLLRAIKRRPWVFEKFSEPNFPVIFLEDGKLEMTAALEVDKSRLVNILAQISVGLYYHCFKEKFNGSVSVFLNKFVDPRKNISEDFTKTVSMFDESMNVVFSNIKANGENPEVFQYKILEDNDRSNVLLLLTFFGNTQFTIILRKQERQPKAQKVLVIVD